MNDEPRPPPIEWLEALDRSEAQLAAGQLIDGSGLRRRLRDSIDRMATAQEPHAVATEDR